MLMRKSHSHRARRKQTRHDRKFQRQLNRINPNVLEQLRRPEFQREGEINIEKYFKTTALDPRIIGFLTFLLIMSAVRLSLAEKTNKISDNQKDLGNQVNDTSVSSVSVVLNQTARLGENTLFPAQETAPSMYQYTLFEENIRKQGSYDLSAIIKKRDAKAFKIYLKHHQQLEVKDFIMDLAGDPDGNEIMLFILNSSKEGGFQYLTNIPKLFSFHIFKEAKKNDNQYLLYVMLQSNIIEEIKPIIATYNNIIKYIQSDNVQKLKLFFDLKSDKKHLKFDTSYITHDLFSDKRIREEFLMISKKSNTLMRVYIESLCDQYSRVDKDLEKTANRRQ